MLKKIRNLEVIVDSLLIPPENVYMPRIPSHWKYSEVYIQKKYFQLFWKQLAVAGISHHLLSAICLEQFPDLISPIKLFTPISLFLLFFMCTQVFPTRFLFLMYCSFSEVSQVPCFSLYKIASKWYITISNQIASFSRWIPPWYPIIYLNPATSSLEIISDHIDWGLKTKRLPHPYPLTFFRCQP